MEHGSHIYVSLSLFMSTWTCAGQLAKSGRGNGDSGNVTGHEPLVRIVKSQSKAGTALLDFLLKELDVSEESVTSIIIF